MNVNILALYQDFLKQNKGVDSVDSALNLIREEYGVSQDEIKDLHGISYESIMDHVENPRLLKKNPKLFKSLVAMFVTAFFFGMFVANSEYWDWPPKEA